MKQSCAHSRIARAAPGPHQARTRPAPTGYVCFFPTYLRRLFSSFSNSENLQILRRTPAQHPTCEFEGAHRLLFELLQQSSPRPLPLSVERARTRPAPGSNPTSAWSKVGRLRFSKPFAHFPAPKESGDKAVTSRRDRFWAKKRRFGQVARAHGEMV